MPVFVSEPVRGLIEVLFTSLAQSQSAQRKKALRSDRSAGKQTSDLSTLIERESSSTLVLQKVVTQCDRYTGQVYRWWCILFQF